MTSAIITVATMKGGSGKSTLASCLAVHWNLQGLRPTIIDADPQRSIARLAARERALGGVPVVEDATEEAWKTADRLIRLGGRIIIDTPGFRSQATLTCLGASGRRPSFRCVLTQTTRDSVIAKHIRAELIEAGFPVLQSEMTNRVVYAEAALWGATPSLIDGAKAATRDIAAIADEVDGILADLLDTRQAARA